MTRPLTHRPIPPHILRAINDPVEHDRLAAEPVGRLQTAVAWFCIVVTAGAVLWFAGQLIRWAL